MGIILTPHIKGNEDCKDLIRIAESRLFQLWKLSNLNVNEENLILVYKSWIRPLFLYSNACWIDQSHAFINKIQNLQNRALRFCLWKPRYYQTQKLHEEANMKSVREMHIKLANGYIERAIKHNILSVLELINKKRQCPLNSCKSTLDHTKSSSRIHNRLVARMTAQNSDKLNKRRINPSLIPEINTKDHRLSNNTNGRNDRKKAKTESTKRKTKETGKKQSTTTNRKKEWPIVQMKNWQSDNLK